MAQADLDDLVAGVLLARPLTAAEIAQRAGVDERTAIAVLERLVEHGRAHPAAPRGRGLRMERTFVEGMRVQLGARVLERRIV